MNGNKRELVKWLIKDMKPYLDFLRDYDRGKARKSDLRKLSG